MSVIPDYSHNSRGLNRFPEGPSYTTQLPDWKLRSIRGESRKSYYHPIPLEDWYTRNKAMPFNENKQVIRFQNWAKERDPFYNKPHSIYNEKPGDHSVGENGMYYENDDFTKPHLPESLVAIDTPSSRDVIHDYGLTREEKTGIKDPDNYNIGDVPRQRQLQILNNINKYSKAAAWRSNQDTKEIKVNRMNTRDPRHSVKHPEGLNPMDKLIPLYAEGQFYHMNREHPMFDLSNPLVRQVRAPTDVRDRDGRIRNNYALSGAPANFYKSEAPWPRPIHSREPIAPPGNNLRGPGIIAPRYTNRDNGLEPADSNLHGIQSRNRIQRLPDFSMRTDMLDRIEGRLGVNQRNMNAAH